MTRFHSKAFYYEIHSCEPEIYVHVCMQVCNQQIGDIAFTVHMIHTVPEKDIFLIAQML